ncbi:MAG: polyphosphate kinase 2 family protein [Verrucomicrobiota bacterium]|nr:polyphosphate kinase 2 family protein [Verrucomicrobiota bacterium]
MDLKIKLDQFRALEGKKVRVQKYPTSIEDLYDSKDEYEKRLSEYRKEVQKLQDVLYANDRYSILLVFQAMDAAGKDGAIKHVMSGINPAGCQVYSFKKPSNEELDHDFLWRTTKSLPERGRIGIFNRSYYEEVLVTKVHPEILDGQRLPGELLKDRKKLFQSRYEDIRNFEKYIHRNGVHVVKFFLNVSKDEQADRLLKRIEDPVKHWKVSPADVAERQHWNQYMEAYSVAISETTTNDSPWYIVPADDKRNARLIISAVLLETLTRLKLKYPEVSDEMKAEIEKSKQALHAE